MEGGGHGQVGLADEGGAVAAEADGVIALVVGAGHGTEHAVGDDGAQRLTGGHHVQVAVDAAHQPLALALQPLGHGGEGLPAGDLVAVGHHRGYILVGCIGKVPLSPQI